MKNKHLLLIFVVLSLTCVLLTACGGGDDTTTPAVTTAAPTTTAPATTAPPVTTAPLTTVTPVFEDAVVTYDGEEKTVAISGLPTGSVVLYSINDGADVGAVSLIEPGIYTVLAKVTLPEGYALADGADLTATLTINKATINVGGVVLADTNTTYELGLAVAIAFDELPLGVTATYKINGVDGNSATNAGTYTVVATLAAEDAAHYELVGVADADLEATLTIGKATINVSGVGFASAQEYYTGSPISLSVSALPTGVAVSYTIDGAEGNSATEIGEYELVATLAPTDPDNYVLEGDTTLEATLEIGDFEEHDMSGIAFVGAPYQLVYDDTIPALVVNEADLPEGVRVTYKYYRGTELIDLADIGAAGDYAVEAVFTTNVPNYKNPDTIRVEFTIAKKQIDLKDLAIADKTVTYAPGTAASIEATGIPTANVTFGYTINGAEGNSATNAGTYTVVFSIAVTDPDNYELINAPADLEATLTINKAQIDLKDLAISDKTVTYAPGTAVSIEATGIPTANVTFGYTINGAEGNSATNAGTYTVVFGIAVADPDNYELVNVPTVDALTATLTISKKPITLAEIAEPSWIYASMNGYDAEEKAILVSKNAAYSYVMTLTDESLTALSGYGITVSYETVKKNGTGSEPVADNAVTATGSYKTTVSFASEGNYLLEDITVSLDWAVCLGGEDAWTPPVNPD